MKLIKHISVFILLILAIFTITRILINFQLIDFNYYYQSIQFILKGISPYNNHEFVLNYPPSALLFFWVFGVMPFEVSKRIWSLLSFFSLGLSVFVLIKSLGRKTTISTILLIFGLVVLSFPVKFTLGMGQVNIFILTLLSLNFFFYKQFNPIKAGIALGLAVGIKITPIFLLLFFWRKKEHKIVVATLMTYLFLSVLAMIFFGYDLTIDYYTRVFWNIPTIGNSVYYNQALTGFLARLDISSNLAKVINYVAFGFLLMVSYMTTKISRQSVFIDMMSYGMFIVAILIGAGLAWQHHFVLLVIPFIALTPSLIKKDFKLKLFFLMLAYVLIAGNIKNPESFAGWSRPLLSHVFFGSIILYLILLKCRPF